MTQNPVEERNKKLFMPPIFSKAKPDCSQWTTVLQSTGRQDIVDENSPWNGYLCWKGWIYALTSRCTNDLYYWIRILMHSNNMGHCHLRFRWESLMAIYTRRSISSANPKGIGIKGIGSPYFNIWKGDWQSKRWGKDQYHPTYEYLLKSSYLATFRSHMFLTASKNPKNSSSWDGCSRTSGSVSRKQSKSKLFSNQDFQLALIDFAAFTLSAVYIRMNQSKN